MSYMARTTGALKTAHTPYLSADFVSKSARIQTAEDSSTRCTSTDLLDRNEFGKCLKASWVPQNYLFLSVVLGTSTNITVDIAKHSRDN